MPRRRSRPQTPAIELSVVVPTRNEAGNVPLLLQRLRTSLAEISFEVVFVDDSDDETPHLLRATAAKDGRVRFVHRRPGHRDGGLSTAVVLGLSLAHGRLVCVMDGDLQHPPEAIPELLNAERAGADVVVASRYMTGGSRQGLGGGIRRLVSRGATMVARTLFAEARSSTDPLAGFFLCRADLLTGLEFRPVGFKILLELLVCSETAKVVDVPLQFQARGAGESKASAAQGWLYVRHLWSLVRDVPGSARRWKFAVVGASGLVIFLGLLELGGVVLRWPAIAAWGVAFVASLAWNFTLNLRLTFADARRERYPLLRRYVASALTAGGAQLLVFLGLLGTSLPLVIDGILGALVGMAANAALSLQLVRRRRRSLPGPVGLEPLLARISRVSGAERAAVLDAELKSVAVVPEGDYRLDSAARNLCRRVDATGVPLVWTQPASARPQARASVELISMMVLPLEARTGPSLKLILHRHNRTAFTAADLEAAMRQLRRLGRGTSSDLSPTGRVPESLVPAGRAR